MKTSYLAILMAAALIVMGCCRTHKADKPQTVEPQVVNDSSLTVGGDTETEPVWDSESWQAQLDERITLLYGPHQVSGTPNIESFVKALPIYDQEYGFFDAPVIDLKNGYFHFSEEGSGGVRYDGAIWNRTDGKKLFIFSYDECDWADHEGHTDNFTLKGDSPWRYYCAVKANPEDEMFLDYFTGFAAYLYNPENQTLEPLDEPPFDNWSVMTQRRHLILPQNGKDIEMEEGTMDDITTRMLKWNGMSFAE